MNVTGLKCADLVDAMGRMHRHRCHVLDLVSPTPGRILFGPAVTISYFPSCAASLGPDRYNLANLFYEAVGDDPAGKVVVLASNGYTDTSMGGGTKLLRLHEHGCAGVLTDGRLRDFDESARYDFAAYCSGEAREVEAADAASREAIAHEHLRPAATDSNPTMPRDRTLS
jgi:4-hydroxy-4-methyl-2-oxoglutarate aldolase